jgi:hypothetical protein
MSEPTLQSQAAERVKLRRAARLNAVGHLRHLAQMSAHSAMRCGRISAYRKGAPGVGGARTANRVPRAALRRM